ncbi:MAG TPA: DUF4385 family protein, partial [Lacipirellulaceae bacterium]|nr:DUF4385 family protein [Lacipirellulaceae bacterium]
MLQRFDYSLDFATIDFRQHPDLYRIGRGEQGVLLVEPYISEILPHWRFKSPEIAERSSARVFRVFRAYLKANDFVGADMARKFLQMGWTPTRIELGSWRGMRTSFGKSFLLHCRRDKNASSVPCEAWLSWGGLQNSRPFIDRVRRVADNKELRRRPHLCTFSCRASA